MCPLEKEEEEKKEAGMLVLADGSRDINILQKGSVCAWR